MKSITGFKLFINEFQSDIFLKVTQRYFLGCDFYRLWIL